MNYFIKGFKQAFKDFFLPITHPTQAWEELKFEWSEFKRLVKELCK